LLSFVHCRAAAVDGQLLPTMTARFRAVQIDNGAPHVAGQLARGPI
jgi:hypothetical protein